MQKRIVLINDLSGFGRCSLTVWLPILSVLKAECLLMPTSILSNHTAYPTYYLRDLSEDLTPWMKTWKSVDAKFDAVMTGYISSPEQGRKILDFLKLFEDQHPILITDPAMADAGMLYPGLDEHVVLAMKQIVRKAQIVTPNLSEACLLTDTPYSRVMDKERIEEIAMDLQACGPKIVVITGIEGADHKKILDCTLEEDGTITWKASPKGKSRHGTGDVFSAVFGGSVLNGVPVAKAVGRAGDFVRLCLEKAEQEQTPIYEGIPFELLLDRLMEPSCPQK